MPLLSANFCVQNFLRFNDVIGILQEKALLAMGEGSGRGGGGGEIWASKHQVAKWFGRFGWRAEKLTMRCAESSPGEAESLLQAVATGDYVCSLK